MTKRKVINPPKVKPADLRGIPDPSNASAEDIYQALNAETGGAVVRRLNAKLQMITHSNTQLREDNNRLARANIDLQSVERGLRADLQGMCTQDKDHFDDLVKLRVSMARVAQAAGVSLAHAIGVPQDAPYQTLHYAATNTMRGWNRLAGAVAEECARLREQAKQHEANEQEAAIERLCEYYKLDRELWDRLDGVVQQALYRVAHNHGIS